MQQSQTVDPAVEQRQQSNTAVGISILSSVVEGRSYVHCTVDIKKKGSQDRRMGSFFYYCDKIHSELSNVLSSSLQKIMGRN